MIPPLKVNGTNQSVYVNSKNDYKQNCYINKNFGNSGDQFEKDLVSQKKNFWETLAITVTGISLIGVLLIRGSLSKALKALGEEVPFTIKDRMKRLSEMSSKDGMTKLLNKKSLMANLPKDFEKTINNKQNFSVAMLDMDNFKSINEIFNHDTGDTFLKRIAANIQEISKKHNAMGYRYGGEEFSVIMPGNDSEKAKAIITEISEAINNDKIIQDYVPKFIEKSTSDIAFFSEKLKDFNELLPQLRKENAIIDSAKLINDINLLINAHLLKYKSGDASVLKGITKILSNSSTDDIYRILRGQTKINGQNTLGDELNKIYVQYKSMNNDLQKWLGHIDRYKMFTVSGGIVTTNGSGILNKSDKLLEIADAALKSAKENGKNKIISANDDIIKSVLDNAN